MNNQRVMYQHGDVLLISVDSIPEKMLQHKVELKDGFIVERGEGVNTHVINNVSDVEVFETLGEMYIRVLKETVIEHEEHKTQKIQPGIYYKRTERVFDYATQRTRAVRD